MIASLGWGVVGGGGSGGGGNSDHRRDEGKLRNTYTTVDFVYTRSGVCVQYVITFCADIISAGSLVSFPFLARQASFCRMLPYRINKGGSVGRMVGERELGAKGLHHSCCYATHNWVICNGCN